MTAKYRIIYKDEADTDITIDLWCGTGGVNVEWDTKLNRNIGSTGIYETIVQRTLRMISMDTVFYAAEKRQLETFLSFAQQGQPFEFITDTTKETIAEVGANISAGAVGITLTAVHSFVVGDEVIITDAYRTKWDSCIVASVAPTTLTVELPITHNYNAGVHLSNYGYFNSVLLLDESFEPDRNGIVYKHKLNCVEVI